MINGIFDGEHYFILEQIDENTTKFKHGENFTGILSSVLFGILEDSTTQGFEAMNEAIKAQAEAQIQTQAA